MWLCIKKGGKPFLAKGQICHLNVDVHPSNLVQGELKNMCEQKDHAYCYNGKLVEVDQLVDNCF
jgi:hypothetical protein